MSDNPVDEFLDDKEKRAAQRRADDVYAWQTWKANPTPQTLQPLLKRFDPMIGQRTRLWKAPNVQESALRANLQAQAIKAFESYDPNKAALNTHVQNRLKKSLRFTRQHQNLAYIPEAKAEKIGPLLSARDQLHDQFGRPPTFAEIGEHVGMSTRKTQEILKAQGMKDVAGSSFESDPTPIASSREQEVLGLLRPALKVDEQGVFDHLYGMGGNARITSTGQIAKKLGKSPSQISRIKGRIQAQYNKYK